MITNFVYYLSNLLTFYPQEVRRYFTNELLHQWQVESIYSDVAIMNGKLFVAPDWEWANEVVLVKDNYAPFRQTYALANQNMPMKCGVLVEHKGIMFYGRIREGPILYRNRIMWSNFGDPEDTQPFGQGNFQNFEDIGDADDEIIKLVSFKDNLYIFKRRSIWLAGGINTIAVAPEFVKLLTNEYGLLHPNAISVSSNFIYFMSHQGLVLFDGESFTLDNALSPRFTGRIGLRENERVIVRWCNYNRFLVVYYEDLGGRPVLYVNSFGKWFRWLLPVRITCLYEVINEQRIPLIMCSGIDNKIYYFDKRFRNDKVYVRVENEGNVSYELQNLPIAPAYCVDWTDLGYAGKKLLRSLDFIIRNEGQFNLVVELYGDFVEKPLRKYLVVNGDDNVLDGAYIEGVPPDDLDGVISATAQWDKFLRYWIDLDGSYKHIKIVIRALGLDNRLKIYKIRVGYVKGSVL